MGHLGVTLLRSGRAFRYIFLKVMARTKDEAVCQFLVENKVWLHFSLKRIPLQSLTHMPPVLA